MAYITCTKCKGLVSGQPETTSISKCICPPPEKKLTGWVCPVCGGGLSPYTSYCPCKNYETKWQIEIEKLYQD